MTRDRRPPGPGPFEPAGSTKEAGSDGRRQGIWASLKRAFGSGDPGEESIPFLSDEDEPAGPTASPVVANGWHPGSHDLEAPSAPTSAPRIAEAVGENRPADLAPLPATAAREVRPLGEQRPTAPEPSAREPFSLVEPPAEPAAPPADSATNPAPSPPRLARGLASFSRSNREREKKFAHILRDKPSSTKKDPRRPGGRG